MRVTVAAAVVLAAVCCGCARGPAGGESDGTTRYGGRAGIVVAPASGADERLYVCTKVGDLEPDAAQRVQDTVAVVPVWPGNNDVRQPLKDLAAGDPIAFELGVNWNDARPVSLLSVRKLPEKDRPKLECR